MTNTVLIKAKGLGPGIMLQSFERAFSGASLKQISPKWWQTAVRYELRIQDVSADDIQAMKFVFQAPTYKIEIF